MHGGLGLDHTYLHPWLDPLADVLRLIYYDHRANGRSERSPLETLTLKQFAGGSNEMFMPTYNVVSQLDKIRVPTLILTGRDDFICPPSQAEIMHKGIPNSELVILEHSGHFPHFEETNAFFKAVRSWLHG
ncbi:alpha/beta fold hydrolase [Chloroflexota bacterium]